MIYFGCDFSDEKITDVVIINSYHKIYFKDGILKSDDFEVITRSADFNIANYLDNYEFEDESDHFFNDYQLAIKFLFEKGIK